MVCDSNQFIGGYSVFPNSGSKLTRKYNNLPSHQTIRDDFVVILLDIWTAGDHLDVMLESANVDFK